MSSLPPRGKTSSGLTSLQRLKLLQSLDGSVAYSGDLGHTRALHECMHCLIRRRKLAALEKEFHRLRRILITKGAVLDVPESSTSGADSGSQETLALIQESAKLRITIDTLMRFQLFEAAGN